MTEHDPQDQPGLPEDRELEEFLARRSTLSRLHREGTPEQAPPGLDAKVLETAREELRQARPRPKPIRRLLRWDGPLALAASTVLVAGLAWMAQQRLPGPVRPVAAPPPAEAYVAAPPAEAKRAGQAAVAQVPDKERAVESASQDAPAVVPLRSPPPPGESAAPPADHAPVPVSPALALKKAEKAAKSAQPPPLPPPPPAAMAEPALSGGDVVYDAAPATPPSAAVSNTTDKPSAMAAEQARDRIARQEEAQEQGRMSSAMAAPMPPPPAPAPQMAAPRATATASGLATRAQPAVMPDPCAAPQRAQARVQAQPEQHLDSPQWLEQIRQLRGTDESAARAELACFVSRRSPAEVPEDLQPLLPPR